MRLEMLHSSSQELVCGWENWPTSLPTQWQFKRVKGPLLKLYQIIELRWGYPDVPLWICQANNPSSSITLGIPLWKMHLEMVVLIICHHPIGPLEAKNTTREGETRGLICLGFLHLLQTVVSKAIGVHYQQCLLCCPDLTTQTDQGIPDEVDDTEKKHAWR